MRTLATQVKLRRLIRAFAEARNRIASEPIDRRVVGSMVDRLLELSGDLRETWRRESRLRPLEATFLVPVRFEPCTVPGRIAEQLQYVDLFPDWEAGMKKVVRAVRKVGRQKPTASLSPSPQSSPTGL